MARLLGMVLRKLRKDEYQWRALAEKQLLI